MEHNYFAEIYELGFTEYHMIWIPVFRTSKVYRNVYELHLMKALNRFFLAIVVYFISSVYK